ncbi:MULTISPECIES: CinA family nicotinamide mononucleotide deamidase-related protein [unclassified Colwellia]|jgi:nicotinamide-nucleotide amidase|uniref:CinA family nicotinamide mononucleotide deamidase-related protein n=1 Tax=unclassified Colwellia TaxID=196834 RepID=UPI0015F71878|nr:MULTISPECIES: CinA family nicotinamide mononucleotide deamidase-related protein [unclassified Colwellia]MBA6349767.1 CinA family nicotinamide mononucleotide deamidase-related protein [Colwellia sp. BRX8-9]MBA6353779.1 CinA family nicotinamide mononucleotide deamidase-related protein [Colwellia sp. BRX9-1]MBA6357577.1 CinA family nicotinamide mononucleotide deamidase-related protein [Colwellia sp. BRX8-3]MBA6361373.1 CinA family nicotinamide mononucleotide deamidase-related protein [Colwellia|tara:strand:- start:826 stop:2100 length:1275 start_codon:yes stop_codon:yes gene_type:complete
MTIANVHLLLTGNELMTGDIVDSNSAMIAQQCKAIGIKISRKVTLADDLDLLAKEIEHLTKDADVLIINGGLGPTTDDLTAQALAMASQRFLKQHPIALAHLKTWCEQRNAHLGKANLKQALLPENCNIIANRVGSAVGFSLTLNDCQIFCTPGVPSELNIMLDEVIIPELASQSNFTAEMDITRLQLFGIGESTLQSMLVKNFPDWPKEVEVGFRASSPLIELKLTVEKNEHLSIKIDLIQKIKTLLNDHIIEEIKDKPYSLAELVLQLCQQKNLKITTAESCTGGLIASEITKVSGSSSSFEAGFVTYSNNMKSKLLHVNENILEQHGAVSEQTVIAMAEGALAIAGADLVIAVSGIAGPTGGSKEKPVGSVWIAWGNKDKIHTKYFCIKANRENFQRTVAARSLDLIRRLLIESSQTPLYF